jgi:hypothetical protein
VYVSRSTVRGMSRTLRLLGARQYTQVRTCPYCPYCPYCWGQTP